VFDSRSSVATVIIGEIFTKFFNIVKTSELGCNLFLTGRVRILGGGPGWTF